MKVNLWFARNEQNEIVSIVDSNNENTYTCPICSGKVIPKAVESKKVTPHYAHVDVDKCNSESMLHWWFKHKFIERGYTFKIKTDEEIEFTCKDLDIEVTFQLESGTYRPDLVIYTECGQEVVFEMANSNKKKVQDYIDRWIELDRIVVEVDIKSLQNENNVKVLNALYYKGKCFNFNKRDGGYYNTIGKLKEEMKSSGEYDIELVKKLDWFWNEIVKYNNSEIRLNNLIKRINKFSSSNEKDVIDKLLKSKSCGKFYKDYKEYIRKNSPLKVKYKELYSYECKFKKFKDSYKDNCLEYNFVGNLKEISTYSKYYKSYCTFQGVDFYEVFIQYKINKSYKQVKVSNEIYERLLDNTFLK